jgi:hypothetical protein
MVSVYLVELGLRLWWPTLPSLAPLATVQSVPAGALPAEERDRLSCRQPPGGELHHQPWTARIGATETARMAQTAALRLWVAGDSVAQGAGVAQGQSFAALLAGQLALDQGRAVELWNLGIQGAAYCNSLVDLHLRLDLACPGVECPDAVVLQLFADDLERRDSYTVQGQVIAFPWRVRQPALRALVSHSYTANLVWSQARARLGGPVPRRGVDAAEQVRFRTALRALGERLEALSVAWVLTLLPPAGLPRCEDPSFALSVADCGWMTQDMDLMAGMLDQEGLPWVDLRSVWRDAPDVTLEHERLDLDRRGRLPVHPDAAGHALLARSLGPALGAALQARAPPP